MFFADERSSVDRNMTLKRLQPATMNSSKLLGLVLIAVGIVLFAYRGIQNGTIPPPPIAVVIAWAGGIVSLLVDGRKRPT